MVGFWVGMDQSHPTYSQDDELQTVTWPYLLRGSPALVLHSAVYYSDATES